MVVVSLLVSWLTGMNKPRKLDPDLLSPVIRRYISYQEEKEMVNMKLMEEYKVKHMILRKIPQFIFLNFEIFLRESIFASRDIAI